MRETDKILNQKELAYQSKDRLALVHGNRFMLHMVFDMFKQNGYHLNNQMLEDEIIQANTLQFCLDFSNVRDYQFNTQSIRESLLNNIIIYGKNAVGKSNFGLHQLVNVITYIL